MKKTAIELFAGVGGFRCGLNHVELKNGKVIENGNWKFLWANQWEPATKSQEAYECYKKRFGGDVSNVDIFEVDKNDIPDHTLLVGGFPCQDYSVAQTLSNSKGIEGKKGVLWWAIEETLSIKKPPFVLLENVDRLLLSPAKQRGRDFGMMLRSFYENGYDVQWRVINAGEYGLPQKRRRTYIFAYHKSTKYYKEMHKLNDRNIVFDEGIFSKEFPIQSEYLAINKADISEYKDLVEVSNMFKCQFYNAGVMKNGGIYTVKVKADCDKIYPLRKIRETGGVDKKYFLNKDQIKKFEFLKGSKKIPRVKPNGEPYYYSEGSMPFPDNLDAPARTMLTSESGVSRTTHVIEDYQTKKLRLLTPKECERINGFPDDWTNTGMTDRKRYFMMGNALVVGVIEKIGKEIENIVEKEE
ncbi:MAG TPA: DNA (cytosine-5-)-methyltransferase [Candidatus Coprosoma intestinipullorum]|uniref:DNA (cytosine-5-)-methyltransferase n=1 Tax=Candidatus Coprosoma intestinipullorum TaxID=2840752 RepID=A0A9D0ZQB3_9FIRM|nr:DNA (cytosine-5-)-methyltransferase [Candidatus Coprosoma intestinipullorum]